MIEILRADHWWQYKLAPAIALFIATALVERETLLNLWPQAVILLVALAACASYVSIINDLTDRADDMAAGKPNRQLGYDRGTILALLIATIVVGAMVAWSWRASPLLVVSYAGSWVTFSLYSLPPFRLKTQGLAGVLCDAAGAHLFPALTAMLVASAHGFPERTWMAAAAIWAFAYGLRGILRHQLHDYNADVRAGVQTFAARHRTAAIRLGTFIAFPAEVIALAFLKWHVAEPLTLAALGGYFLLLAGRARLGFPLEIVVPKPHGTSVLQEYYDAMLPIALLLSVAQRHGYAIILVIAFIALFRKGVNRIAADVTRFAAILLHAIRVLPARMRS